MKSDTLSGNRIIDEDIKNILSADIPWFDFDGVTILVTGGSGLLGSYIVDTLLAISVIFPGHGPKNILVMTRNSDKARDRFSNYKHRNDLKFIANDVCNRVSIEGPVEYIIHAASPASPNQYSQYPAAVLDANITGTRELLELARTKKSKGFMFLSSGEVYGKVEKIPTKESDYGYIDLLNIRSCYSEGKRAGEALCVAWFHQHNVPAKIVRPFHTYGPRMEIGDGRVFADFVEDILENRNITLFSDGAATRAFCYISDAITGFFTVLLNGESATAYNIGSGVEISIVDLAEKLVEEFSEKNISIIRKQRKDSDYLVSPIDRACPDISLTEELGWLASISVEKGFRRVLDSFTG
jgi:nucleoside-diphosphate-sugar epimerase